MEGFKRILIACPTAAAKNYCFNEWLDNVMNFTYPCYDIKMYDNTPDRGKNAVLLNNKYREKYGETTRNSFRAINSLHMHRDKVKPTVGIIERMALSHNDCREATLSAEYDYLLHLESDVFPPSDVIERLLWNNKKMVSALYYVDEGVHRSPMIQLPIEVSENYGTCQLIKGGVNECAYLNGEVLKVSSAGLGCMLIHNSVLKKISFRWEKAVNKHPDTFFSEDCLRNKISVFCDTSIICEHRNKVWGIFGVDYN